MSKQVIIVIKPISNTCKFFSVNPRALQTPASQFRLTAQYQLYHLTNLAHSTIKFIPTQLKIHKF